MIKAKIENKVMNEFFEKWEQETIKWFEEMKTKCQEIGNYKFSKEYKNSLSKQNMELIRFVPIDDIQGMPKGIKSIIAEDMEIKKATIYAKVINKVGNILEVNLHGGEDGTPNGTIKGENGMVTISTIVAGGYNVQCLHYRVLVK